MTPKEAKTLLKCSYTTLANYVRNGKITCKKNPLNNRAIYNDAEIYALAEQIATDKNTYEIRLSINGKTVLTKTIDEILFNQLVGDKII